jgi:indolepyruvate ferredoxin oxidoreductase beta subunit
MDRCYDVYLVGVGGQGVLTIGEILAETAFQSGWPVNFFPTKGMAQRGGFFKAQLRLGRETIGPNIPERSADLVIAMERSEALKAIRFPKPGGIFLLWDFVWAPTAVMLGQASYPLLEAVAEQVKNAEGSLLTFHPSQLPLYQGQPGADNLFVLGAALAATPLRSILPAPLVEKVIESRWKKGVERNLLTFRAGQEAAGTLRDAGS